MNTIPFPGNYERYYEKGMVAFLREDFEEAHVNFEKALAIQLDKKLLMIFLELSLELRKFASAVEMVEKNLENLDLENELNEWAKLYIRCLIEDGQYGKARSVLEQLEKLPPDPRTDEKWLGDIHFRLASAEAKQEQRLEQQLLNVLGTSAMLQKGRKLPFTTQKQFADSLAVLPPAEYDLFLAPLLSLETVHPLIKTEIVMLMSAAGNGNEITICKMEAAQHIVPADLPHVTRTRFYVEGKAYVAELFGDSNPILKEALEEDFLLYLLLLYPLQDEIVPDVRAFLNVIIKKYDFSRKTRKLKATAGMEKLVAVLAKTMQELQE